ncbi:MAG: SDR family oxidoreductase [Myxococcota bacterium]
MSIFITGATGYLGGYVADHLLRHSDERLSLLVRAKDRDQAVEKLWKSFQLHQTAEEFWGNLGRIDFVHGDLHAPGLGIDPGTLEGVKANVDSILHIAASLNRKSAKACLNTNLRGTLSVVKLARLLQDGRGLRRFSHVSTVAVAGKRDSEVVYEDSAIEWDRSDYDPYARTKKFCEHMVRELLPDVTLSFFRPSIVLGDSRKAVTSQFDMIRAVAFLADLPIVPLDPNCRVDIVPADYVAKAVSVLHRDDDKKHDIYHLSGGQKTCTAGEIAGEFAAVPGRKRNRLIPALEKPFARAIDGMNAVPGRNAVSMVGALMKVFWPYVTYDTVFDNARVVDALGEDPVRFTEYGVDLYEFAKKNRYRYPYKPLPTQPVTVPVSREAAL